MSQQIKQQREWACQMQDDSFICTEAYTTALAIMHCLTSLFTVSNKE